MMPSVARITKFMKRISIASCALLLLLVPAGVFASNTFTFHGPIYASYKKKIESGGGCVSGSIGTTIPGKNYSLTVFFASEKNSLSTLKTGHFGYWVGKKNFEIDNDGVRGGVFTICLKPGRYHILGLTALGVGSVERVHVPFDVTPGKHTYLGSFVLHNQSSRPSRCSGHLLPMYMEIRDELARDAPLIKRKSPKLSIAPAVALVTPPLDQRYFVSCGLASLSSPQPATGW